MSVYGVKLHLLCTINGSPYPATHPLQNVADLFLSEEPTSVAKLGREWLAGSLGDLAYRSEQLREAVTEVGVLFSDRALQVAMWRQPARRDRYLELEAGVKSWRDVGYHAGGTGDEDRDKDLRLHLCVFG